MPHDSPVRASRMIVPFICVCCGAPLNCETPACEFCRVQWKMVKRHNGPDIPDFKFDTSLSSMSFDTASYSFPLIFGPGLQ